MGHLEQILRKRDKLTNHIYLAAEDYVFPPLVESSEQATVINDDQQLYDAIVKIRRVSKLKNPGSGKKLLDNILRSTQINLAFVKIDPQLLLHSVLLPLNSLRLYQMFQLIGQVRTASQGDLNMNWLKPFMSRRACKAGEIIFRKDDLSSAMFYTVSGSYRLHEIEQDVAPGQVIGEVGLIAPDNRRTLTFECIEDGELLTISYEQVKQLYFQNPKFGFYFLQLISQRLFRDIARLQDEARIGK